MMRPWTPLLEVAPDWTRLPRIEGNWHGNSGLLLRKRRGMKAGIRRLEQDCCKNVAINDVLQGFAADRYR